MPHCGQSQIICLLSLKGADKDINKAVKKATRGSKGLPFKVNKYFVRDSDKVDVKMKNDGSAKSVSILLWGKKYKAKKGKEWEFDKETKVVSFFGDNLTGSYRKSIN